MCYCDEPELFSVQYRKSRKEHKCSECNKKILKGQEYWNFSGKWNGEFGVYKYCITCEQLRRRLIEEEDIDCIPIEKLLETAEEIYSF